ncbi:hypothetical protein [Lentzea aerocolonigenes]|uniref:hypothetical protein n=1 Tax=Lentzea aerocolonigenes TaxID=68170 RepID=UPI000AE22B0D|nr:hypothetical protein [Lentzea aerocolonigenes]
MLDDYAQKHDLKAAEFWDEGRMTELLDAYPDVHNAVSAMTTSHVLLARPRQSRLS